MGKSVLRIVVGNGVEDRDAGKLRVWMSFVNFLKRFCVSSIDELVTTNHSFLL